MNYIETIDGNSLYFKDWGKGRPVVLVHGWPLNADMWEWQMSALVHSGYRVVAYDRRGFGRSSQPFSGYDYDTLADDLNAVLVQLDLHDVALVGFSMGGGEVARYLSRHGTDRVKRAVLLGAVTPYLLQTPDHPNGAPGEVFDGMIAGIENDRMEFFRNFGLNFYGVSKGQVLSQSLLDWSHGLAMMACLPSTVECVNAFGRTDFRADMKAFTIPTLIQHGDADLIVPIDISARVAREMIAGSKLIEYPGAPHGLFYTHREAVNRDLLAFLGG